MVWGWLFVLSTCSYLVDYFGLQGYLRWSLILLFMVLKAGLIVAVFMHMAWERLALVYAILLPPVLVLVFVAIMVFESDYTHLIRVISSRQRRRYHCLAEEGMTTYVMLANWTDQGVLKVRTAASSGRARKRQRDGRRVQILFPHHGRL